MNKDLAARMKAAPKEITVSIMSHHIGLYKGRRFEFDDNPISFALKHAGWIMANIGRFEAYIGGDQGGVPYLPSIDTSARIQRWMEHGEMEPFTAEFIRQPIAAPKEMHGRVEIGRDEEIAGAFY
jgi:hypothetical protein